MERELQGAATALLIGLLLGLEREHSHKADEELFAGIRTFPLLTLAGYLAGLSGAPLAVPATVLGIAALAVASHARTAARQGGATTEVVAILAPILGAVVQADRATIAAAVGVVITLLLTLKAPLHRVAGSVTQAEILSILKFAVVAVVLLPLLPTTPVDPWQAVVPRHVGWVVVLLCGVSLGAYLLVKWLGPRAGWALAGALGGLVSSTATTLSFASRARELPELIRPLSVGILLASSVLYARGLFLVAVFDARLALFLAPQLAVLLVLSLVLVVVRYRRSPVEPAAAVSLANPVELGRAFVLAIFFAAILLAARLAQDTLGTRGLWATGAIGGLLDVDSVAIAVAGLRKKGIAPIDAAAGAFLLATLANLGLKGGVVAVIGGRELFRQVAPAFAALAAVSVALLVLA